MNKAKSKLKAIHDTYRRIVSTKSLANESERQHYDNLSFLRDSCLQKP